MAQLQNTTITSVLTLPGVTTVTAPEANNLSLFAQKKAGRMMLSQVGPTGFDTLMQPHFATNRIGYWAAPGNATTVPLAFGLAAPTANGSATQRAVATTNIFTRCRRLGYLGAASANSVAGYRNGAAQFTTGSARDGEGGFFYLHKFGISNGTPPNPTMFIGLNTITGAPTNVAPNTTNSFGIGLAPGSNNLQVCYGGSTAQPRIDLGSSFIANTSNDTIFEVSIFSPRSVANASNTIIYYSVVKMNATTTVSNTGMIEGGSTILPSNTTLLGLQSWRSPSSAATAVALDLISLYIETDN